MALPRTILVRVCKYDPKRGFTARSVVRQGERFTEQWKELTVKRVAELQLKDMKQENGIQPMFQFATREEALEIEAKAVDRERMSVLNARSSRINALNKQSLAVQEALAKEELIKTSDETAQLVEQLQSELVEKEGDEAQAEAEVAKVPPPAPTPRRRRKAQE